jgi:hypothetical protein
VVAAVNAWDDVREAAARLRQLAEAATPGPWVSDEDGEIDGVRDDGDEPEVGWGYTSVAVGHGKTREWANAPYMAAMHSLVGLALAEWLDETATDMQRAGATEARAEGLDGQPLVVWVPGDLGHHPAWTAALRLARLYLGRSA